MKLLILFSTLFIFCSCSVTPERMVTRKDLDKQHLYKRFVIQESPEQVLDMLNKYGEVVLESKRNIPGRDIPVHVKILATSSGLEIIDYDR